jgi:hypothetical protein
VNIAATTHQAEVYTSNSWKSANIPKLNPKSQKASFTWFQHISWLMRLRLTKLPDFRVLDITLKTQLKNTKAAQANNVPKQFRKKLMSVESRKFFGRLSQSINSKSKGNWIRKDARDRPCSSFSNTGQYHILRYPRKYNICTLSVSNKVALQLSRRKLIATSPNTK